MSLTNRQRERIMEMLRAPIDFFDEIGSSPCANCESEPQRNDSLFCSRECQDEYEGEGDYAYG
jgi:hypothetical protein